MPPSPIQNYDHEPSKFARRFFWLTLSVFSISFGVARGLEIGRVSMPLVFSGL